MKKMKPICLCVMAILLFVALVYAADQPTICTDVSEYGHFTGTAVNRFVRDYINSFFPEQIEDTFANVKYSYKAAGNDNYDFEAYLEFTISDTDTFQRYVAEIAPEHDWEAFSFDADYQIYLIENGLDINVDPTGAPENQLDYPIERARIRTVLYNAKTQTVIFWALGVYDGGGAGTDFLNVFFERFGIDPVVYEQTADSPHGQDPYGID